MAYFFQPWMPSIVFMTKKILLDPNSVAGGGSASPSSSSERPISVPEPRTDAPPAAQRREVQQRDANLNEDVVPLDRKGEFHSSSAAPPAAEIVLNGEHSERELKLQEDLKKATERAEKAEGTVKDREIRNAELQDKLDQLTAPPAPSNTTDKPLRIRRFRL